MTNKKQAIKEKRLVLAPDSMTLVNLRISMGHEKGSTKQRERFTEQQGVETGTAALCWPSSPCILPRSPAHGSCHPHSCSEKP